MIVAPEEIGIQQSCNKSALTCRQNYHVGTFLELPWVAAAWNEPFHRLTIRPTADASQCPQRVPMLSAVSGRLKKPKSQAPKKATQSGDIREGWAIEE
jgi:hypothetical protein